MSVLHVGQIKHHLTTTYLPHVNMMGAEQQHHQLSRATAALAVSVRTGLSPDLAGATVTDDTLDGGVDAVAYAADRGTLVFVQSKWTEGTSSVSQGDVLKFIDGVKHIVNNEWESFGGPLLARRAEISSLIAQPGTRVELVVATTGTGALADPQKLALGQFCGDMNDSSELASYVYLDQSRFYEWIAAPEQQQPDLTVNLRNWGTYTDGAYTAYYGTASAQEVVEWYAAHGGRLFSRNIRLGLDGTEVNDGITSTAKDDPSRFWFFNNGVTVLAQAFEEAPHVNQKVGTFTFKQASIVNGAQTVSSLHRAAAQDSAVIESADVFVRFVTIDDPDGEFGRLVTRRTNTQNRVGAREFVSQDPVQSRIRTEFAVASYEYAFRTGEIVTDLEAGCDLTEATVALACVAGIDEAVLAKREIGQLWEDIASTPYKRLFNEQVSAAQVWAAVTLSRLVEEQLRSVRADFEGRNDLVLRHGNRVLNWAVAQRLGASRVASSSDFSGAFTREEVKAAVSKLAPILVTVVAEKYADSYPLPLFRNQTKCREVGKLLIERSR